MGYKVLKGKEKNGLHFDASPFFYKNPNLFFLS